jgi:molybdenum cofactor cytidylyltransferase
MIQRVVGHAHVPHSVDPFGARATVPVAGIILAAGASTRMGNNKLLVELGGEPVVRRAARRALEAALDPVIVVLGHEPDRIRAALGELRVQTAVNARFADGLNGSLAVGLDALPAAVGAVVVMLADMPFVTADMVAGLVAQYRACEAPLVVSEYDGVPAPPVLYDRALFAELRETRGEGSGREVMHRHRAGAAVLDWPATSLADLDVPDDLARVRSLLAAD